jgi:hypothetical protein
MSRLHHEEAAAAREAMSAHLDTVAGYLAERAAHPPGAPIAAA